MTLPPSNDTRFYPTGSGWVWGISNQDSRLWDGGGLIDVIEVVDSGGSRKERRVSHEGYENLLVWQEGMKLVRRVYQLTGHFPAEEKSGMVASMRKLVMGIPGKIADATVRDCPRDIAKQIDQLRGPVRELESYVTLARHLHYISKYRAWRMNKMLSRYAELLANESVMIVDYADGDAEGRRRLADEAGGLSRGRRIGTMGGCSVCLSS